MVGGAISISGMLTEGSSPTPFVCVDFASSCRKNARRSEELGLRGKNPVSRRLRKRLRSAELSTPFVDEIFHRRSSAKMSSCRRRMPLKFPYFRVVGELGGQYEDTFADVKLQLINYFTYKAVRTVLNQLYEMNPSQYMWFYNFVASNDPSDGKRFIQTLVKEKQELAERVMVTRLHLYGKWIKICDHDEMYKDLSDENLELMRERLMETIVWPSDSDESNPEKID